MNDSTNDLQQNSTNYNYVEESNIVYDRIHHHNHHRSGSITMRANRVPRSESIRSSSASSSSGCMSEQSSIVSTPSTASSSSGSSVATTTANGHDHHPHHLNYHHLQPNHMTSPHHHIHHHHHHHLQQPVTSNNAFDADFPIGTIKRKPNVMIQPKIPLTNTTRNLALQSDDALLEVSGSSGAGVDDVISSTNGCDVDDVQNSINNNNRQPVEQFQRGTFKSGTLRRSTTTTASDETQRNKTKLALVSPQHHPQIYNQQTGVIDSITNNHHSDDDLPPPPPPPPLKEAESTLSLNASFPPPPSSPEMSEISQQQQQSPDSIPKSVSPIQSKQPIKPPSMASLPLPPMTPQPQMKTRLARRLSDLSENSTYFMNFRGNYNDVVGNNNYSVNFPQNRIYAPNSRASFASSSDSTSFVTLKSNFLNNNNRRQFQRHNSVDYNQHQHSAWDKYGTSPRIRPIDTMMMNGNIMNEQFYQQKPITTTTTTTQNYMAFNPSNHPIVVGNSHCSIIPDTGISTNNKLTEYDIPPARVKIYNNSQQQPPPPPQIVPPPPTQQQQQQQMNYASFTPTNSPCHQAINRPAVMKQENHYMSISPHLLQKHQQMIQRHQQQQQPPVNYCPSNTIYAGNNNSNYNDNNVPYHLPEDLFLKNMERVMQKKWHVAQMLQQDQTATPGQVLGFRDSAYLPPPPPPPTDNSYPNMVPPPPPSSNHHYNQSYNHHHQQQQQYSLATANHYHPLPYHHQMANNQPKSVQFSDNGPIIMNMENISSASSTTTTPMTSPIHHQPNYNMTAVGGQNHQMIGRSKIPPPPPKRSESTQLTVVTTCPSRR